MSAPGSGSGALTGSSNHRAAATPHPPCPRQAGCRCDPSGRVPHRRRAAVAGPPAAARRHLGRRGHQLRAVVAGRGGGRACACSTGGRRRRDGDAHPADGDDLPRLARLPAAGRPGPAVRLPGRRAVRPRARAALQPGQAAARPVRAGGRRRVHLDDRGLRVRPQRRGRSHRTPRRTCRGRSSCTTRSRGATTPAAARRGPTPSSTSCTSRASPRGTRACREPLRGTYAGLAHPAAIEHLHRPRGHRGRADAGAPLRHRAGTCCGAA